MKNKTEKSIKYLLSNIIGKSFSILFFVIVIFGIVFPVIDTLSKELVCSGGETLIENCIYRYGTFMTKSPFLNWFIWFAIIQSIAVIVLVIGKLINRNLSGNKRSKKDDYGYKSKEKFERNVSACDYRKWSK